MPVILPIELEQEWLDPQICNEHALSLFQPYRPSRWLPLLLRSW
jgi:hypothetical protein